jgi:hypothetical protein
MLSVYTLVTSLNACLLVLHRRKIDEKDVTYTHLPGHVSGYGALVNRIGRGFPRSISAGREFSVVCTYPYEGPDIQVTTVGSFCVPIALCCAIGVAVAAVFVWRLTGQQRCLSDLPAITEWRWVYCPSLLHHRVFALKLTCSVLWPVQVATKLMEEAKIREQEAQLAQARPEG